MFGWLIGWMDWWADGRMDGWMDWPEWLVSYELKIITIYFNKKIISAQWILKKMVMLNARHLALPSSSSLSYWPTKFSIFFPKIKLMIFQTGNILYLSPNDLHYYEWFDWFGPDGSFISLKLLIGASGLLAAAAAACLLACLLFIVWLCCVEKSAISKYRKRTLIRFKIY